MGKVLGYGNIREKGTLTIPKEVREYLKIKPGDPVLLILEHGQIVLKKGDLEIKID
jgi:AbrB family looped-hinge helix DNA binding protein